MHHAYINAASSLKGPQRRSQHLAGFCQARSCQRTWNMEVGYSGVYESHHELAAHIHVMYSRSGRIEYA